MTLPFGLILLWTGLIKKFGHDGKGTLSDSDVNPEGPLTINTVAARDQHSSATILLVGEGEQMLDAWAAAGGKHEAARVMAVQRLKEEWQDDRENQGPSGGQVSAEILRCYHMACSEGRALRTA